MRKFFEVTFSSADLNLIDTVLKEWLRDNAVPDGTPEVELAAAVMINLFREGNNTLASLKLATSKHKGLCDLSYSTASTPPAAERGLRTFPSFELHVPKRKAA